MFDDESPACHVALVDLRELMSGVGFVVDKKRDSEATLRAYVGKRLTYPLLNPRFTRRRAKGLKGSAFLEITLLSKGHENLDHRLLSFANTPLLTFVRVGERQGNYFCHGRFLTPLSFQNFPAASKIELGSLQQPLHQLLKYLGGAA